MENSVVKDSIALDSMYVGLSVIRTDSSNKYCNVRLRMFDREVMIENVLLNSLLASRLNNESNENVCYDKEYYCQNNSADYKSGPFSLIKFMDGDGDLRYTIKPVDLSGSSSESVLLPTGVQAVVYKNYRYSQKNYLRYIDSTVSSMKPDRVGYVYDTRLVLGPIR